MASSPGRSSPCACPRAICVVVCISEYFSLYKNKLITSIFSLYSTASVLRWQASSFILKNYQNALSGLKLFPCCMRPHSHSARDSVDRVDLQPCRWLARPSSINETQHEEPEKWRCELSRLHFFI